MNDYVVNLVVKILNLSVGLFVAVGLARYLSVEARGEFGFWMSSGTVAAIVFGAGMSHSFIFRLRQNPGPTEFRDFVGLLLVHFGAVTTSCGALILILNSSRSSAIVILACNLLLYQQLESAMAAFDIRRKIRINSMTAVVRLLSFSAVFAFAEADLWWPVAATVATNVFASANHLRFARSIGISRPNRKVAVRAYRFGWLPMASSLLVILNYNVDIVMLRLLGSPGDLGYYVVAAGIITYMWVIPDAIKEVLVSRVVRSKDLTSILTPLRAAVTAAISVAVIAAATGPFLVPLTFGREYSEAYPLVLTLSVGSVSIVYFKILGVAVLAHGWRREYFLNLGVAVASNIFLNFAVIPQFGAQGAALVSVATYSVAGLAFARTFARRANVTVSEVVVIKPTHVRALLRATVALRR